MVIQKSVLPFQLVLFVYYNYAQRTVGLLHYYVSKESNRYILKQAQISDNGSPVKGRHYINTTQHGQQQNIPGCLATRMLTEYAIGPNNKSHVQFPIAEVCLQLKIPLSFIQFTLKKVW